MKQQRKNGKDVSVPSCDDAFHDGREVLPAVTEWHLYLRNSSRKSDTITDRILDLVDYHMLKSKPDERYTLEQVCKELDNTLTVAKDNYDKQLDKRNLAKLSPETLRALLDLDNQAPIKATPGFKVEAQAARLPGALGVPGEGHDTSLPPTRIRKSERFDKILSAKTANRQDVLQTLPTVPRNPQSPAQVPSHLVDVTPTSVPRGDQGVSGIPGIRLEPDSPEQLPGFTSSPSPSPTNRRAQEPRRPESPSQSPPILFNLVGVGGTHNLQHPVAKYKPDKETTQALPRQEPPALPTPFPNTTEYQDLPGVSELPAILTERSSHQQGNGSRVSERPRGRAPFSDDEKERPGEENIGLTAADQQVMVEPKLAETLIWKTHEDLEKYWANPGPWGKFLGKVPQDPRLKRFIQNRDIIFVIDNAYSMREHWEAMETTLLTLAMKIGPLDKDGLDLDYTCGETNRVSGATNWNIRKVFRQSINKARSELDPSDKTDMAETLARIFDVYMRGTLQKRQTIIILTDGLWEGSKDWTAVEKEIAQHINAMREKLGRREHRWFTIQFISFGQNRAALDRLRDLDDKLRGIDEDVVDAKPWYFPDVEKIILGSIKEDADEADGMSLSPISDDNISPLTPTATARSFGHRPSRYLRNILK